MENNVNITYQVMGDKKHHTRLFHEENFKDLQTHYILKT